jgi:spermidine synthase
MERRWIPMHLLAKELTEFNEIHVYDSSELYGRMGKYRLLKFSDEAVQGALDLKDPRRVVLEYQKAIIHLMEFNDPSFENVFLIGHGIGTIAGYYPNKRFTVAEIDEKVVGLSKRFFGYRMDNVVIGDGRQILREIEPNTLDYVFMDAYSAQGTPHHLNTLEFFNLTMEKLDSRGMFITNLVGKIRNDRLISAIYTTLGEVYTHKNAFFLKGENAADAGNVIIVGSNRTIEFQVRDMAGFVETEIDEGHIIMDPGVGV